MLILVTLSAFCASISQTVASTEFDEHYNKAVDLYSQDHYSKAIAECDQAIKADPQRYEAYLKKARALNQIGKAKEGLAEFNKCLKLKKLGEIYQSRGLSYRMLENYPAALSDWWRCIKMDPDYEKAYWRIADLQLKRRQYQDCLKVYALAIANKSTAARGYRKRGQLDALMNKYDQAIADHSASLKLKPDDPTTYYSRAKVHSQFKHFDLAVKDMRKAVELSPKDSSLYTVLGAFCVQAGKLQDAADVLDKAISLEPGSASAHNNRGVVYEKLGQLEKAKSEFDKAVEHDPGRAIYYANHARVAVTTGDTDDAVDDFINMDHDEQPESASAAKVNFKIVIAQFDKVIKLNPSDPGNYYNRGVANYCIKNFKDAHRDFDTFIRLAQWHGDAPFYAAILDSTALRRLHKNPQADDVLAEAKRHHASTWSTLLIQGLTGEIPSNELLQASRLHNKEAAAHCFLGLKLLSLGKNTAALDNLDWVRDNADKALDEYSLATSQLVGIEPVQKESRGARASTEQNSAKSAKNGISPPILIVK
ncbi:MAG: tetratricopeptide repeat protein [Cyanobacteria bacterium SZAS-4]|nr:tetratricopeptide repeat protein [Cyanobacteria bacterium SZAS-4]